MTKGIMHGATLYPLIKWDFKKSLAAFCGRLTWHTNRNDFTKWRDGSCEYEKAFTIDGIKKSNT